jgi:hypothetical protein
MVMGSLYYGYIDGKFDNYSERQIKYKQYEIIDLNHEILIVIT